MANDSKDASDVKDVDIDNSKKEDVPKDRLQIIYVLFFLLGLVHLLPWSFFTTATKYWMYKFRNTTIDDSNSEFRTSLQAQFNAAVTIALQVSEVTFLIVGLLYGRLITVRTRLFGILIIIFHLFIVLTVFVKIDTDSWQEGFFAMVLALTAGINSMNAVLTVTIYTAFSQFPQRYLAAYLLGSSLARIFTSSLQILSLATGLSVQDSALVYFCLGLFVIASTFAFLVLTVSRNRFYKHHMKNFVETRRHVGLKEGWRLFKKVWSCVVMMGVFLISTNATPGALVVSENEGESVWSDVYFIPTITFLLSAVCEMIGRYISFKLAPNFGHVGWTMIALIRTILVIPLTMFCNAQPRNRIPVFLPHDYQYIIIVIFSSITGGYVVSRCSYNIAGLVTKEELKDTYHVFMLLAGLLMGALSVLNIVSVNLL